MSASKSGRTDADDGRERPPPPAGTGGRGPRCRIDGEETASKISYRKVRRTSSPPRRVGRRVSEPNLCISLLLLLLDIFTPREKSSPRAKSRSRHRRRCRVAAMIPPFSRRRYFVTSKQFGVARCSFVCSPTLLFRPPPFFRSWRQ